jgi:hypothetical protein
VDNWREASFSTTMDRLDNNRDGRIDEPGESIENDGIDNDFDGTIDEPGEGVDEPDESSSDPRLPPRGDDRPLRRLDELMSLDGWTRDVFDALAPHLTVFSVSQAGYPDRREPELGRPQIDPNTAPPEAIFRALREAFPDLPEALIGQYTVNLIDRRDPDDLPTQMTFGGVSGRLYIGYEITPLISEVCPDVPNMPGEKDNGQFVEIVNPHDRTFSLDGWRLEGAGAPVYLRGSLQPGAALVITDDADGSADPDNEAETPGMGSLYDVFGVVASGPDRRVQVEFGFDLPDARGAVRLYDPEDNPIDLFEYQGSGLTGARLSFQRPEPRLRFSRRTYATPLEFNRTAAAGDSAIVDRDAAARIERGHNQPFRSPLDLMFVSTSFAEEATGGVDPSAFADETIRRRYPNMEGTSDDNLDLGVVDVFLPGAPRRADWRALDAAVRSGSRRADATGGGFGATGARRSAASRVFDGGEAAQAREIVARNAAPPIFGRVNLNTAPGAIVASLPGMDVQTADRIVRARRRWVDETVAEQRTFGGVRPALTTEAEPSVTSAVREDEWFRSIGPQAPARWKSLADFLKDPDVWGTDSLEDRMRVMYPSSLLIAFHSQSLRVVTESLVDPRDGDDPRRASVQRAERLIGVDRGTAETVTFRYLERIEVDADALFAVPVGEAPLLAAQLFAAAGLGLDKSAASTILPADVQLDPAALTLDRSNALTRSSPPPVKNR